MDEALRAEAGEQTLGDALFQVEVNRVVGEDAGVLEHDGARRFLLTPLGQFLVAAPGTPQGVQRAGPARVGVGLPVQGGEGPDLVAVFVPALL